MLLAHSNLKYYTAKHRSSAKHPVSGLCQDPFARNDLMVLLLLRLKLVVLTLELFFLFLKLICFLLQFIFL